MSAGWVIAFVAVALAAGVDQLVRTHRFVAVFGDLTAWTEAAAADPAVSLTPVTMLMARIDHLHRADRRAMTAYAVTGVAVLAAGWVLS